MTREQTKGLGTQRWNGRDHFLPRKSGYVAWRVLPLQNTLRNVEEGRFQLTEIDTKVFEIEKWHEQRNR